MSLGGGCEADVLARTKCGWVNLRGCSESLYERGCLEELCKASNSVWK